MAAKGTAETFFKTQLSENTGETAKNRAMAGAYGDYGIDPVNGLPRTAEIQSATDPTTGEKRPYIMKRGTRGYEPQFLPTDKPTIPEGKQALWKSLITDVSSGKKSAGQAEKETTASGFFMSDQDKEAIRSEIAQADYDYRSSQKAPSRGIMGLFGGGRKPVSASGNTQSQWWLGNK